MAIDYFGGMNDDFTGGLAGAGINNEQYGLLDSNAKRQLSNQWANGGFGNNGTTSGFGDSFSSALSGFGSAIDGISGLAGMWMDYDKLKSQKRSARDAHNASAQTYNNQLTRARDVQASISGPGKRADGRQNIKNSTV